MSAPSASIFTQSTLVLKDLGYLPKSDDDYDRQEIQSAVVRFQLNHGLLATGVLDFPTVETIMKRRCGTPDIVDGVNFTRLHSQSSDGPSCFTLLAGAPKWYKLDLSYSFESNVPAAAKPSFRLAFAEWDRRTRFTFSETSTGGGDIVIGFYRGAHGGDCTPFNGPGGAVAHSFKPCDGRLHVDLIQQWSYLPHHGNYFVDLESVGLHEIGHILGLNHSSDKDAVMYAVINPGQVKNKLTNDDIRGINFLYCD